MGNGDSIRAVSDAGPGSAPLAPGPWPSSAYTRSGVAVPLRAATAAAACMSAGSYEFIKPTPLDCELLAEFESECVDRGWVERELLLCVERAKTLNRRNGPVGVCGSEMGRSKGLGVVVVELTAGVTLLP
jgi:hypothetical protein